MRYYSEETVKGLLERMDSHFVKYLESLHSIEIKEPHGRCIDVDALPIKDEWSLVGTDVIWDAPTVLEATDWRKK